MELKEILLDASVSHRVDELIHSHHRRPLLSTTGTHAAVDELIEPNHGLELALRELSAEVEHLRSMVEEAR